MNPTTTQALITFSEAVADAISRAACGKDVDRWEVLNAQEALVNALEAEPAGADTPQDTSDRITERPPEFTKVHGEPTAIRPNVSAGMP